MVLFPQPNHILRISIYQHQESPQKLQMQKHSQACGVKLHVLNNSMYKGNQPLRDARVHLRPKMHHEVSLNNCQASPIHNYVTGWRLQNLKQAR
jgi:hypothetical protein